MKLLVPALLLVLSGGPPPSAASDLAPMTPAEVKERWHSRLDGRHFAARVRLEMNMAGLRESRRLIVWRDDRDGRDERVLVRFEQPPDLRNVRLLYLEHGDQPNDYFLYQPSTRRVRRLPQSVANDDLYGVDLEFLGFGVAQTEPTEVEAVSRVFLHGRPAYRLTERARDRNSRFDRRTTWIDAENFVAVRTEHELDGREALVAEALELATIQDVPTPVHMSFRREGGKREVELYVEDVDYRSAIPDEYFSVMALVRARRGD